MWFRLLQNKVPDVHLKPAELARPWKKKDGIRFANKPAAEAAKTIPRQRESVRKFCRDTIFSILVNYDHGDQQTLNSQIL